MAPRFSIVYPTRDRPEFIARALGILARQRYEDFEVIVSDNATDPSRSCEQACRSSRLATVRYVRPPEPTGMVEHWNFALNAATGEYVLFLTDKMFLLPDALGLVARSIDEADGPEVVTWTSDGFAPADFGDYFGPGIYVAARPAVATRGYRPYSPAEALKVRGRAEVSRPEQGPQEWARGKLVFGAYRRDLISRIHERRGALFRPINPDYTSMILGLSEAHDAIELGFSCVVSVTTDLSNGMQSDADDASAISFLRTLSDDVDAILQDMLVPGMYASLHNWVAHDYLTLQRAFDLPFGIDIVNWLAYCYEDVHRPGRRWSDPRVESDQHHLFDSHLAGLDPSTRATVRARIDQRAEEAARPAGPRAFADVRRNLPRQVRRHFSAPDLESAVEQVARDRRWFARLRV